MSAVQACALPDIALLGRYRDAGAYTDCYATELAGAFSHAEYVEAFYTTTLFKVERALLRCFVSKTSTDGEARELAAGQRDSFAAWIVEARGVDQLLLSDFRAQTRSWLMTAPGADASKLGTRLYFGSAVVPVIDRKSGKSTMSFAFRALIGFHKLYSRALLSAAASRLDSRRA